MVYHYYLSANSSRGYVNLAGQRLETLPEVAYTTGYPAKLRTQLMGAAIAQAKEKDLRLDVVHEPLDGSVAGIILPEQGRALWNTGLWQTQGGHVLGLMHDKDSREIRRQLDDVYSELAFALKIHDEWEKIYIDAMDFDAADELADAYAAKLVKGTDYIGKGKRTDAFFGASTPDGSVDYIANLTTDLSKRYFLKGRPGTGKSTFLNRIIDKLLESGLDTEVYHCSFDPKSLDMLIVRELGVCIFDSTAPHEYFPSRMGDEIIDLYAAAVKPETDEKHVARIGGIAARYQERVARAREYLAQASALLKKQDAYLEEAVSDAQAALAMEELMGRLFP